MNEDYREGLAIAQMVTYGNLVQTISCLNPNDPFDVITSNSLETLSHLKTHGFDVGSIQDRLNRLLSLKSIAREHEDAAGEISVGDTMQKVEEELVRLQLNLHLVSRQLMTWSLFL
ncbi:hypothetical protein Hanom_Chr01g00092511 [Helianthus anomalus]